MDGEGGGGNGLKCTFLGVVFYVEVGGGTGGGVRGKFGVWVVEMREIKGEWGKEEGMRGRKRKWGGGRREKRGKREKK